MSRSTRTILTLRPLLLSREQMALALGGVSVSHLDRLERAGKIGPRPVHLGERLAYVAADVERWVGHASNGSLPTRVQWDQLNEATDGLRLAPAARGGAA